MVQVLKWTDFTKKQVDEWNVKYHELLLGKPQYDIFVDDRLTMKSGTNKII